MQKLWKHLKILAIALLDSLFSFFLIFFCVRSNSVIFVCPYIVRAILVSAQKFQWQFILVGFNVYS